MTVFAHKPRRKNFLQVKSRQRPRTFADPCIEEQVERFFLNHLTLYQGRQPCSCRPSNQFIFWTPTDLGHSVLAAKPRGRMRSQSFATILQGTRTVKMSDRQSGAFKQALPYQIAPHAAAWCFYDTTTTKSFAKAQHPGVDLLTISTY